MSTPHLNGQKCLECGHASSRHRATGDCRHTSKRDGDCGCQRLITESESEFEEKIARAMAAIGQQIDVSPDVKVALTKTIDTPDPTSMPEGYRWATADETERHLNKEEIHDAVWVTRPSSQGGSDISDLAVPQANDSIAAIDEILSAVPEIEEPEFDDAQFTEAVEELFASLERALEHKAADQPKPQSPKAPETPETPGLNPEGQRAMRCGMNLAQAKNWQSYLAMKQAKGEQPISLEQAMLQIREIDDKSKRTRLLSTVKPHSVTTH